MGKLKRVVAGILLLSMGFSLFFTGEFLTRTYDAENRLKTVSSKTGDNTTLIQTNDYNGDGQRIQKVEGDTTTNYHE